MSYELDLSTQSLFRAHFVTRDFSPAEFSAYYRLIEKRSHPAGTVLIGEGEPGREVFFLEQGRLEVSCTDPATAEPFALAVLEPGAVVGEVALIDQGPASATVRALSDVEGFALPCETAAAHPLYPKMALNVSRYAVRKLRDNNGLLIERLADEVKEARDRSRNAGFFIATVVALGIGRFFFDFRTLPEVYRGFVSWGFLLLLLLPMLVWALRSRLSLEEVGLTGKGWRRSLGEGALLCVALVPLILGYKHFSRPDAPWIEPEALADTTSRLGMLWSGLYLAHSFVQEFISRGLLQNTLTRFMRDQHWILPILTICLLFGILHLHISREFAFLTALIALPFGLVYQRHRSLIGVTLIHFVLGMTCKLVGLM